ncbi:MAG: metallophosphoesterase [Lachnospiraceae bacterium]|nr:metallophosphoesterase [Desulfovibrio sp.]MBR4607123.1 metallophosphoesterase [Lachnospiraceae bacterium]
MPNILVLGDVHGEWAYLASLLLYLRPDICIVAGDFGWWPGWGDLPHEAMPREVLERTELHFADGNHENHRELLAAAPRGCFEAVEIAPRIIYHPRGSIWELPDGRRIFFAGGAKSVDWRWRHERTMWFREELLLRHHLPESLPRADIVISHTVSTALTRTWTRRPT